MPSLPLVALGAGLLSLGILVVPGTQEAAATVLVFLGSAFAAVGVVSPSFSEMELSPTKFRLARGEVVAPQPWMIAEAEILSGIARKVLGDAEQARDTVEEALSRIRRFDRRIPEDKRELTKLKTLVALLDRADQRRLWSGGDRAADRATDVLAALQRLDFRMRVALALRSEFPVKQVAEVLDCSEAEVDADLASARTAIGPFMQGRPDGLDA